MVCSGRIGPHERAQSFRDARSGLPDEKLLAPREDPARVQAPAMPASTTSSVSCSIAASCMPGTRSITRGKLALIDLVAEQYPLVVFHGDVGTGKTAMAECIANRLVADAARRGFDPLQAQQSRAREPVWSARWEPCFADAFQKVAHSAGKNRRAILIMDEGDSLGASRAQEHSHHEDKVAVNTLIQGIDGLRGSRRARRRIPLCTNRLSVLDAAIRRRAAIIEEFRRPSDSERRALFEMDLAGLAVSGKQFDTLGCRSPVRAAMTPPGHIRIFARASIRQHLPPPIRIMP